MQQLHSGAVRSAVFHTVRSCSRLLVRPIVSLVNSVIPDDGEVKEAAKLCGRLTVVDVNPLCEGKVQ